ncbi:unnamed protein product [Cyclocybe aegerita]|uniref:Uncharacterized protein n=1 Tax=Cyclocybe aegerita TaxID=1973307 RepID=A0A8S0XSP0_CYCAE|nr:unnamed protein product [Cyclocybe aegerita]
MPPWRKTKITTSEPIPTRRCFGQTTHSRVAGYVARSDVRVACDAESKALSAILEDTVNLFSAFTSSEELSHTPCTSGDVNGIHVGLNDAALPKDDHTCPDYRAWAAPSSSPEGLKLRAGTGMPRIVAAKNPTTTISSAHASEIIATTQHPRQPRQKYHN